MSPRVLPRALTALALVLVAALGCRAQAPAVSIRDELRRTIVGERKPCELKPAEVKRMQVGGLVVERVRFTPEPGQDAVAVLYRPMADGKYPAVIVQHFLGGSKDDQRLAFLMMSVAAQKGVMVAAIDGRYRGDRQNGKSLEAAMVEALRTGKGNPFLIDTAYDVLRFLDYLETRDDVDPRRIGMTGLSEGGIITWMCAAVDDRIRVAAPVIGVTVFNEAIAAAGSAPEVNARIQLFEPVLREHAKDLGETEINARVLRSAWQKLVPGMLDRFDAPNVIPLIAPRPLLILSHEKDELFPIEGARKVADAARTRYRELSAEERFEFRVVPGLKHAAFDPSELTSLSSWFDRWLKSN